jgi:ornithine lipid hydroxylase
VHFHPIDVLWMQLISLSPLLALGAGAEVLTVFAVFAQTAAFLQHCNVKMRLGALNALFNTPDYHRWHHSPDRRESDYNFGGALILWDAVFRTRFLPRVAPRTDLGSGRAVPATYVAQLLWPLRRWG